MFHQILSLLILLRSTYVYPCSIKRIAYYLFTLRNQFLHKVSGMEENAVRYFSKGTLLYKVDSGIGVIVKFWLFQKPLDVATVKVKNAQFYTYIIGDSSNGHFRIVLLKMKEEIFIIDISEKIRIHHKNGIIIECIYKLNATNSTKELGLPECTHLHTITRCGKMPFQLLSKIVDRHIDMLYSIRNQTVYIMVNNTFSSNFKQWLGGFLRQWTETFPLPSCHQYSINGEFRFVFCHIDNIYNSFLFIKYRNEHDTAVTKSFQMCNIKLSLLDIFKITMHYLAHDIR